MKKKSFFQNSVSSLSLLYKIAGDYFDPSRSGSPYIKHSEHRALNLHFNHHVQILDKQYACKYFS